MHNGTEDCRRQLLQPRNICLYHLCSFHFLLFLFHIHRCLQTRCQQNCARLCACLLHCLFGSRPLLVYFFRGLDDYQNRILFHTRFNSNYYLCISFLFFLPFLFASFLLSFCTCQCHCRCWCTNYGNGSLRRCCL